MKERPINFSAPMVCAVLNNTKMQTRRIVKNVFRSDNELDCVKDSDDGLPTRVEMAEHLCPYGQPGDRLWVREDHHITIIDPRAVSVRYIADDAVCREVTIGEREFTMFQGRKKPLATTRGRFMWRCLSRIQLEITGVRVERLQDISEADAKAEGVEIGTPLINGHDENEPMASCPDAVTYREAYCDLWGGINGWEGPGSWAANPWVWVVEFRRVTT